MFIIPFGDVYNRPRAARTATWVILLLNVAIFFLIEFPLQLSSDSTATNHFFLKYGLVPAFANLPESKSQAVVHEQVPDPGGGSHEETLLWKVSRPHWLQVGFLTSMFLHGGIAHLFGNMLFFWIFADNVEDMLGTGLFVPFYLTCGIISAAAEVVLHPHSTVAVIGASGAIAGILGAYVVLFPRNRIRNFYWFFFFWTGVLEIPAYLYVGFWFLMQLAFSSTETSVNYSGVAYAAHVGGFLAGALLILVLPKREEVKRYYDAIFRWNG